MRSTILATVAFAIAGLAAPAASAASFLVTVERPGAQVTSSTFTYGGTEGFTGRTVTGTGGTTSFTSTFNNSAVTGAYSNVGILNANEYGGAGNGGQYAVAWNASTPATSYTLNLSTTQADKINYFGLWISAADSGNQLQFYKQNALVYSFSTADFLSLLNTAPGASAYYGNPNGNNNGVSAGQAFGFLNFYDRDDTFDKVVFTETNGNSGFESDNHTVGRYATTSGTAIAAVPEPATWAMMIVGFGAIGASLRTRRSRGLTGRGGPASKGRVGDADPALRAFGGQGEHPMPDDIYTYPEQRQQPAREENVSPDAATPNAATPNPSTRPDPAAPDQGAGNRGHAARVTKAGEVVGSGSAAGGGGTPEDFDSDEVGGDGGVFMAHPPQPDSGGDGSKHGST